uniref:Putative ovule protein n=1 Tax=Solanum chacoense TaxID=4108 RepID=A0A0V0HBZ5_SOLCH
MNNCLILVAFGFSPLSFFTRAGKTGLCLPLYHTPRADYYNNHYISMPSKLWVAYVNPHCP